MTDELRHTPGPWKADPKTDWSPWPETFAIISSEGTIAWTTSDAHRHDRNVADAHLIAAAPELLAALADMVETFKGYQGLELTAARAAMAKAREGKGI